MREPIEQTTRAYALAAARKGLRLRAVASASLDHPLEVTVKLKALAIQDPLHHIVGPEKGVVFDSPEAGQIAIQGGRSSPRGAALAMMKDVLNLKDSGLPGFH